MDFQLLTQSLIKNGKEYLISEHSECKLLSTSSRKELVNAIYDYLTEDEKNPSEEQITVTCKAVLEIFPSLKFDGGTIGGIVS